MSRTVSFAIAAAGAVTATAALLSADPARAQQFAYDSVVGVVEAQGVETQRMVAEVVLIALEMELPGDAEHLSRSREAFNQTLRRFRDDSSELGARTVGNPEITEQVFETEDVWRALDDAIGACIAAEAPSDCDVATIAQLSEELQNAVDNLVEDLKDADGQDSYSMLTNAVLAVEGAQALSQQMMKEFLLVAYGHQPDRYRSSLRGSSQQFEQKLLGLLEGDFDQLLLPPPTPEIRDQLERIQQVWQNECQPLIDLAVAREDLDQFDIARMSRAGRNLFREIGSANQLYRGL